MFGAADGGGGGGGGEGGERRVQDVVEDVFDMGGGWEGCYGDFLLEGGGGVSWGGFKKEKEKGSCRGKGRAGGGIRGLAVVGKITIEALLEQRWGPHLDHFRLENLIFIIYAPCCDQVEK